MSTEAPLLQVHAFSTSSMATVVTIQVVSERPRRDLLSSIQAAFGWFAQVEQVCTRFDARSEARRCTAVAGRWQVLSPLLFEAIAFGLRLAERTDGAFDPTLGQAMERQGYNTSYVTGVPESSDVAVHTTFRDVELDASQRAIRVAQPLVLDLNSIAKGLAIDLAALALPFPNVSLEAGGDIYVRGHNAAREHWRVGVADPAEPGALIRTLSLTDCAICTSSGAERGRHHLDGRTGQPVDAEMSSVTVIAPTALVADALSTAALVCGVDAGRNLLQAEGVQGIIVTAHGSTIEVDAA